MDQQSQLSLSTEIQNATEVIEKLKTFTNELEKRDNNILTHLCDGLETFLGFDSASKGYDGSGIVYSDLDRLCDAVMGFLSGVLEGVKKDKNLEKYSHNTEKAIEQIKNKNGKSDLANALPTVTQGIDNYVSAFEAHSKAFKMQLETISSTYVAQFNKNLSVFQNAKTETKELVANALERCNQAADQLAGQLSVVDSQFNNLDDNLKNKLKDDYNAIKNNIAGFAALAGNGVLLEVIREVDRQAGELKALRGKHEDEHKKQVTEKITQLKEQIEKEIEKIIRDVKSIERELQAWIKKAEEFVKEALEKVNKVHEALDTSKQNEGHPIGHRISGIENANKDIDIANSTLGRNVEALDACIRSAEELRENAENKAKSVLNEVDDTEERNKQTAITQWASDLQQKAERLLNAYEDSHMRITKLPEDIKNKVTKLATVYETKIKEIAQNVDINVRTALSRLEGLDAMVKNGLRTLKDKKIDGPITDVINSFQGGIQKVVKGGFTTLGGTGAAVGKSVVLAFKGGLGTENGTTTALSKWAEAAMADDSFTGSIAELEHSGKGAGGARCIGSNNDFANFKIFLTKLCEFRTSSGKASENKSFLESIGHDLTDKVKSAIETVSKEQFKDVFSDFSRQTTQNGGKVYDDIDKIRQFGDGIKRINRRENIYELLHDKMPNYKINHTALIDAINHIPDIMDGFTQAGVSKGSIAAEKSAVSRALRNIKDKLQKLAEYLNDNKEKSEHRGIIPILRDLKDKIGVDSKTDTTLRGINSELEQLKGSTLPGHTSKITEAITEIKRELRNLRDLLNRNVGRDRGVIPLLQELQTHIGEAGTGFQATTGYFQKNGSGLGKIIDTIHTLREKTLDELMSAARAKLDHAESTAHQVIAEVHDLYQQEIQKAMKAIRDTAKEQYRAVIGKAHRSLVDLYNKNKKLLDEKIKTDEDSGIKGLMKRMMGDVTTQRGGPTQLPWLTEIQSLVTSAAQGKLPVRSHNDGQKLQGISQRLQTRADDILTYIETQVTDQTNKPTNPPTTDQTTDPATQLTKIEEHFDNLLVHLHTHESTRKYIYDNDYTKKLASLSSSLAALSPSHFANPRHPELLDAVRAGLQGFVTEMGKVYVNGYDGHEYDMILIDARNQKVTEDGKKCAKVFLTILPILQASLKVLKKHCNKTCKTYQIHKTTDLGKFFAVRGYEVSEKGKQNGELQDKDSMRGGEIHKQLVGTTNHVYRDSGSGPLDILFSYLETYNDVCHLSTLTATRQPCSVYEMLVWLSGLTHSPVHNAKLDVSIIEVIEAINDKEKQKAVTAGVVAADSEAGVGDSPSFSVVEEDDLTLVAYPSNVSYDNMRKAITHICSTAYDVLTTIAGHGDEYTIYGSDLSNNSMKFYYPRGGEDCLDMILDILRRLLPQLRYLRNQCMVTRKYHGWRECQYGKAVASANLQCTEHATGKPTCHAKCQPKCEPNCQPNSPLMSYLNDCLPGHLPHQLRKIGCKFECTTCPSTSKKGMPCLTPLGFRCFSGSIKKGEQICEILGTFFANVNVSSLFCLVPRPPTSLPEHFQFVFTLVNMLSDYKYSGANAVKTGFEKSTNQVSIGLYDDSSELTCALRDAYSSSRRHGNKKHLTATQSSLSTLSMEASCTIDNDKSIQCGPYLSSTCSDAYYYVTEKHSDMYLSWAIYLPWTLYNYLKSLFDAFQQVDCGGSRCTICPCKPGTHGVEFNCKCKSLGSCRGVQPTFYQHGFTLADIQILHGTNRKYCHSFSQQLSNVLKSDYFKQLFKTCDNFLWKIREPFIWLNVALWLLSLLYLLHIMVIRLDLLHIKSHLHSPSSHRISAQSLLAAARVNKLNRVFYLQP